MIFGDHKESVMKTAIDLKIAFQLVVLILLAGNMSGCALGWFAGGAATGAVAQHNIEKHGG